MSTSPHRIRRQQWALKAGSEADALSIRIQMRDMWEIGAQPAFEAAFDAVVPGPETVHLPRLEVSVRVRDVHELTDVLQERVRQELRSLVDAARVAAAPDLPPDKPAPVERSHRDVVLAHYLSAGNVPWHAIERDPAPAIRALEREALDSVEDALAALHGISHDETALAAGLFRLLQLLPEDQWLAAAERFLGAAMRPPVALIELLGEIAAAAKDDSIPRHGRIKLVAGLVAALATTASRGEAGAGAGVSPVIREALASWMQETGLRTPVDIVALLERWPVDPKRLPEPATERILAKSSADHRGGTEPSRRTDEDRFPLAVASAGLVLLHPYISQLFTTVGIVLSEDVRAGSSAVDRAAALLHLLATGREDPYELELGFIKVLLGFTPETALPVAGGLLSDVDRDEAETLLQAVVGHWTALKHTSVRALRASFLQRTGLVEKDDNGWRLRIERGPFDVLLERLPWGIGTVKLPWMSRPIFCEWPTA